MPDAPRVLSFFDGSSFSTKEVIVSHPSEATIRRLVDVFMTGDREAAARMFAEAAVFAYEGPGPLHGHYGGHDGIISFWAEQDRRSGAELRPQLIDLVAGDRRVFLLVRFSETARSPEWLRVVVYDIDAGVITGARVFEENLDAAVKFFSRDSHPGHG